MQKKKQFCILNSSAGEIILKPPSERGVFVIKPLWAVAGVALLGTAGVAGALVVVSSGGEEEVIQQVGTTTATSGVKPTAAINPASPGPTLSPSPTPGRTPGTGETVYRWMNLEMLIPDGSGILAGPGANPRTFTIVKRDPEDSSIFSQYVLDAENGAVVEEHILEQHRTEMDRVRATLNVSPFDPASAPWPYNGEPTDDLMRENEGGISFIRPKPVTGLYVGGGLRDPGGFFITLENGRSIAFVGTDAKGVYSKDTSAVLPEDTSVFDRWLAIVKQCSIEIEC
jgi:hypothetical protein